MTEQPEPPPPTPEDVEREAAAITKRIRKVEQARLLADAGKFSEALAVLAKLRDTYPEERMRRKVDWMIEDVERRAAASGTPISSAPGESDGAD